MCQRRKLHHTSQVLPRPAHCIIHWGQKPSVNPVACAEGSPCHTTGCSFVTCSIHRHPTSCDHLLQEVHFALHSLGWMSVIGGGIGKCSSSPFTSPVLARRFTRSWSKQRLTNIYFRVNIQTFVKAQACVQHFCCALTDETRAMELFLTLLTGEFFTPRRPMMDSFIKLCHTVQLLPLGRSME